MIAKCPQCHKPLPFVLDERADPDGDVVMFTRPCPCGFTREIGRLTARGVALRQQIAQLRAMPSLSPAGQKRLDALTRQYTRELTTPED